MTEENDFIGELEEMDMSEMYDKMFMVAISTGPRDGIQFLCSTVCGPLNFYEMVETVSEIYKDKLVHAKVIVPSKEFGVPPKVLDENTIDYIEARSIDILMDSFLSGEIDATREFTCKAGFLPEPEELVDAAND